MAVRRAGLTNPLQSALYLAKVEKEKEKLQKKLIQEFNCDIYRGFTGKILTDVRFISTASGLPVTVVECHSALLRKRLPSLWHKCSVFQRTSENIIEVPLHEFGISEREVITVIESLYTVQVQRDNSKAVQIASRGDDGDGRVDQFQGEEICCSSKQQVTTSDIQETNETMGEMLIDRTPCSAEDEKRLVNEVLEMFSDGTDCDVTLILDGNETVLAHRFLLACRSRFFEVMLTGNWKESDSGDVHLPGISRSVCTLLLEYLYGSLATLPEACNIREIAQHADMWELPILKECVLLHLRQVYCHFFHKPCSDCLSGVPECLLFSNEQHFIALQESCLKWIHKYFPRAWSQKSFALLPPDLVELCFEYSVSQLTFKTAVTVLTDVDKLRNNLPSVNWADPIRPVCQRLLDESLQFTAQYLTHPVVQWNFRALFKGLGWSGSLLTLLFNEVIEQLNSESAAAVLIMTLSLNEAQEEEGWNTEAVAATNELHLKCRTFIVKNLGTVQYSAWWPQIPAEVQQKLREGAVFVDDRRPNTRAPPVLSSSLRNNKRRVGPSKTSKTVSK